MDTEVNPYAPPNALHSDIESFARRYRVDASRTTLREFQNLSGKPILGTLVWIAMRIGLTRFDSQIIDGPRPFAEDQCKIDDLREPVRSHLLAIADSAEKLGFHSHSYSVSKSTGVDVHGGAIRMLHDSGQSFLQILASSSTAMLQGYEIIVSATSTPVTIYATTNGPPNYNAPAGVIPQRHVGRPLKELLDSHNRSVGGMQNLMCFESFAEVGSVMDHLSGLYFTDKIARGIFVQQPEVG